MAARKWSSPEEIIGKLREAEVAFACLPTPGVFA